MFTTRPAPLAPGARRAPAADAADRRRRTVRRAWRIAAFVRAVVLAAAPLPTMPALPAADPPLPALLSGTGLFAPERPAAPASAVSSGDRLAGRVVDPAHLRFSPQYPLWSDGADKRRWLALPRGTAIDGRRPDAWVFPPGTRVWKAFSMDGRPVETRYVERLRDGRWRFASYVWNAAGSDATLAPAAGVTLAVGGAPGGRYAVPSRDDCLACHEGAPSPVLGFTALQLSPDRDPLAPHAAVPAEGDLDLAGLLSRGLLRGDPAALRGAPPRIAGRDATERAALGYLHGNCGHCHNADGVAPAPVALRLAQRVAPGTDSVGTALDSVAQPTRYRPAGATTPVPAVTPGRPDDTVLLQRMRSRQPQHQMPPLGTQAPDVAALDLVARWIEALPPTFR